MTFIFSGSDGIYTGASINVKPINNENTVLVIKSTLKTAGWLLMGNGDGNGAFSTSSIFGTPATDVLTIALTGVTPGTFAAGSTANGRSWFVLQQTASSGSFCFQNLGTAIGSAQLGGTTWRIKYSSQGFLMSTSTTSRTPSTIMAVSGIIDEMVLIGGGTDASPTGGTYFSQNANYFANLVADNVAPYGWFYAPIRSGSALRCESALLYEPIAFTGSGDADPYIVFARDEAGGGNDAWDRILDNAGTTGPRAFIGPLVPYQRSNSQVCAMRYTTTETNDNPPTIPTGLGTNPFTGNEDIFPIVFSVDPRAMAANPVGATGGLMTYGVLTGYKGVSTMVRWLANSKSYGDTLTGSSVFNIPSGSNSRMVLASNNSFFCHMVMPWTGTLVNT